MKLFIPELDAAELKEHGFNKNDIFQRKEFGDKLKNLVKNSDSAITIGLDSRWGNGKTTFIKMWQGHIKDDMKSIYFDAFANDYQKDTFLALITEIYELIKEEKEKEEFKKKAKNVIKAIIRGGLKRVIPTLSGGIIDNSMIDSIGEALIDQSFKNATEDKKAMTDFRDSLGEWSKKQKKPVVFIIDELDRCRPDFALELIENIKHLFSVERITFLLVINKTQLEQSIKCRYGDINASEYLQKFVHLWLQLPRKTAKNYNDYDDGDDGGKYTKNIFNKMMNNVELNKNIGEYELLELLKIIRILQPSFREINQILTLLAVSININNQRIYVHVLSRVFVCYFKICKPCLLEKIIHKEISADKVFEDIKIDSSDLTALRDIIKFDLGNDDEREEMMKSKEGPYSGLNRDYGFYYPEGGLIKKYYDEIGLGVLD